MDPNAAIQLENVSKHYTRHGTTVRALDGVTLEVPRGALALLRGPSGCGKTTLINVTAGLTRPTAGSVMVAGQRLEALSPHARAALRAKRVAVVFQLFHLVPYLSAFENVLLPTLARPAPGARARAEQLMTDLGIAHRLRHFPGEMSVGERQRCALARALLNRPDVILADEPTGNLDDESARLVLDTLGACRNDGATILLVSHQSIDTIRPNLQFNMNDGRIL